MQAGFSTGRNAAAFTEARCNANQEPRNATKNSSPVHKRRMLNTKTKIHLATKKKSKQPCHQPSHPTKKKTVFIFELTLQQLLGLAPSAPKFALLSAEAAAKARPCGRDPRGGGVFHPDHKGTHGKC